MLETIHLQLIYLFNFFLIFHLFVEICLVFLHGYTCIFVSWASGFNLSDVTVAALVLWKTVKLVVVVRIKLVSNTFFCISR